MSAPTLSVCASVQRTVTGRHRRDVAERSRVIAQITRRRRRLSPQTATSVIAELKASKNYSQCVAIDSAERSLSASCITQGRLNEVFSV